MELRSEMNTTRGSRQRNNLKNLKFEAEMSGSDVCWVRHDLSPCIKTPNKAKWLTIVHPRLCCRGNALRLLNLIWKVFYCTAATRHLIYRLPTELLLEFHEASSGNLCKGLVSVWLNLYINPRIFSARVILIHSPECFQSAKLGDKRKQAFFWEITALYFHFFFSQGFQFFWTSIRYFKCALNI